MQNKADSGPGSLRQAILDANSSPGPDLITFNISAPAPFTIVPTSPLPVITESVIIDGTTQPGYAATPLVTVSGSIAGDVSGLIIRDATNCEIRGLVVHGFSYGIRLERGGNHRIAGNFIGTSAAGTSGIANRIAGLAVENSGNNLIGGTNLPGRNLISGNGIGLYISGQSATNNRVEGNFIGTDVTGLLIVANTNNGVLLSNTRFNTVGGSTPAQRNIISGNHQSGVYLFDSSTTRNQVAGNYIGTSVTGTTALSNRLDGVTLYNASGNLIGGFNPGEGNLISGNHERGIYITNPDARSNRIEGNFIGINAAGTAPLGNRHSGVGIAGASYNTIGGAAPSARNILSGNQQNGIAITGSSIGNQIAGNYIGTDPTGTAPFPNLFNGIVVVAGTSNVIGLPGAGNLVSGNTNGIYLQGGVATAVAANLVGTDVTGRSPLPNQNVGIRIEAPGNRIGGDARTSGNVISGNRGVGVLLFNAAASNNIVAGNRIGTDLSGTNLLANWQDGVHLNNAGRNIIGGTSPFAGNVISGNGFGTNYNGIALWGTATRLNRILNNVVGTDATGTRAIPNRVGIFCSSCPTNSIGEAGAGNVVSGNNDVAISIGDANANGNIIQGNVIGFQRNGTLPLGNTLHGIEFWDGQGTIIGGTNAGEGNRIGNARGAGYDGVRIRPGSIRNSIRGNSMVANGGSNLNGLGIDLGNDGVQPNDGGDGDGGANTLQNYPIITSATGRYITALSGTLNSRASQWFTLDFYGNINTDPSGYGEGERWLGSVDVKTGAGGNATFAVSFTNLFGAGNNVTATATDENGNTSEMSALVSLTPRPDTDGDGLPDDYELATGLNPTVANGPNHDTDGDGASDHAEFAAATNPQNAADALKVRLERTTTETHISFRTVPGKTYRVESAATVTSPWRTVADALAGNGLRLQVTDPAAPPDTGFYRVLVN